MLANLSISKKIAGGIGLVSALGLASGIAGIVLLLNIEREVNEITDYAGPIVEATGDLVAATAEAHKIAVEMLADENSERIVGRKQEFDVAVARFASDYEGLDGLVTASDLQAVLDEAGSLHRDLQAAAADMMSAHDSSLMEKAEAVRLSRAFDLVGDDLLRALDSMAEANEAEMQVAEDRGDALASSAAATVAQLNDLLGALFEEDYPAVEAAMSLQIIVEQLEGISTQYLVDDRSAALPNLRRAFEETAAQARAHFETLSALAETDADRREIAGIRETFETWVARAQEPEQLFDTHDDRLAARSEAALAAERVDDIADALIARLADLAARGDAISAETDEQAAAQVRTALLVVGVLSVAILTLSALLFWVVRSTITAPLVRMVGQLRALADGKLDVSIGEEPRADEIGQLNHALAIFQRQGMEREELARAQEESRAAMAARSQALDRLMIDFEGAIGDVVETLSASTGTLQTSAATMEAVAKETSETSLVVSASAEEASSSVQTIATGAEEMSASVGEIGRQARDSSQRAETAKAEAGGATDKMKTLSTAAQKIGNVVTLIQEIAEQTNLLALNATIEAARAGEAGKGFAVVAAEVKDLAAQTAKATADIATQVNDMQSATVDAAEAIESVTDLIATLSANAAAIAGAVDQQAAATQEIASSVAQTAQGTSEVSGTIATVSNSAREAQAASTAVMQATRDLAEQSDRLQNEVARFIAGVKAA